MVKVVFITKGAETFNGKPSVSFGKNASQVNRSTRSFRNIGAARSFANKKAKMLKLKNFNILVSTGIKKVRVK